MVLITRLVSHSKRTDLSDFILPALWHDEIVYNNFYLLVLFSRSNFFLFSFRHNQKEIFFFFHFHVHTNILIFSCNHILFSFSFLCSINANKQEYSIFRSVISFVSIISVEERKKERKCHRLAMLTLYQLFNSPFWAGNNVRPANI